MTSRLRTTVSLLLGITSVILSFWMLGFFAVVHLVFVSTDFTRRTGQTWRTFAFRITTGPSLVFVLAWLGLAAILAGLGYWLASPHRSADARTTLVAAAVRFCLGGLAGVVLSAVVLAGMLVYRWFA
jgi:hypothetical protein